MTLPPLAALSIPTATASSPATEQKIAETARRFEAAFLTPLVEEMLRSAGPASLGAGNAEEIWRSFQAGAIAEEIAKGGSTGIAQSLSAQLKAYGG